MAPSMISEHFKTFNIFTSKVRKYCPEREVRHRGLKRIDHWYAESLLWSKKGFQHPN